MNWLRMAVVLSFLVPLVGVAEDVPMIGQDDAGVPIEIVVPKAEYARRLTRLVLSTQESTTPVLKKVPVRPGWSLRTVVVGVGLSLTAGIGPIFELNATPRFRLAFTNSTDPVLP